MDESTAANIEYVVGEGIVEGITANWESLLATAADVAAELDRETIVCEPTDVTVVPAADQFGLTAVVDDETFSRLDALDADAFEPTHVARAESDGLVLLLVVFESDEQAVVLPLYYERTADAEGVLRDHDELPIRVRSLTALEPVSFLLESPEYVFPETPLDD
ncbi:DUF7529 family protein [Halosegnis longus]|uniref:Uncharacterized protein n=1 Tax=Halosegnis longus TaxID=2216012 RepID=A0AAJ4R713_9EURY|nr:MULTISPECIES: hypothetical protein [Halobacteriales]RNJ25307.1 hypothetical protein Nmn1133_00370 [Salella cibi]